MYNIPDGVSCSCSSPDSLSDQDTTDCSWSLDCTIFNNVDAENVSISLTYHHCPKVVHCHCFATVEALGSTYNRMSNDIVHFLLLI